MQSQEQVLIARTKQAQKAVEESLFKQWQRANTIDEREALASEAKALKKLTNSIIKHIKGDMNG